MALPTNIILLPGGLIIENYEDSNFYIVNTSIMGLGIVRQVYDDFGIFSINDIVVYSKSLATTFKKNSTTFWFVNEQDIYFGLEAPEP